MMVMTKVRQDDCTTKESAKHPCDIGEDELDHDIEWVDDSFDHEFGTEVCGHWECARCNEDVNN